MCICNGHLNSLFFPPPCTLHCKSGEKKSLAFAIHAKFLPWHGTTYVFGQHRLINKTKTNLNILSYGPPLLPFLWLTSFPVKATFSIGLSTEPAPPNPSPTSIPTCGSSSPAPLAALHKFREKSKHMPVILWLISVCLNRGMGWRN